MKYLNYQLTVPVALLLLSACSDDEPMGSDSTGRPMAFSVSIANSTQSRVSETADGMGSVWSDGDRFSVSVRQNGSTSTAYCTLNSAGEVTKYSKQLYWNGTGTAEFAATYSNIKGANPTTTNTVDLADQRNGLAYLLWTYTKANYGTVVPLTFSHQLAKVRVIVSGNKASEVNSVSINNYTSCTLAGGIPSGGNRGYIKMHRLDNTGGVVSGNDTKVFEANVVPMYELPDNLISLGDDFTVDVSGIEMLEAGKVYTITINAEEDVEETTIDINGHTAVLMRSAEQGGKLYFATCNIGASTPAQDGLYFWWGDVIGHEAGDGFDFSRSNSDIETYGRSTQQLYDAGYITTNNAITAVLKPEHDAAVKHWNGTWRMPTQAELAWLRDNCTWIWQAAGTYATDYPAGYKVVSDKSNGTGGEIFLPAGGHILGTALFYHGTDGYCWSSSRYVVADYAHCIDFNLSKYNVGKEYLYCGLYIRPVSN